MIIFIIVVFAIIVAVQIFLRHEKFGAMPTGERKEKINSSPQFRDGKFHNINHTPNFKEGTSTFEVMKDFFFNKSKLAKPPHVLPGIQSDLKHLSPDTNYFVWFGHSSYLLKVDGRTVLVDPVFSGSASPIRFTTLSFKGSDMFTVDDMPAIDYLVITHDHWDHLDHKTIVQLRPKVGKVIASLGVGAHLEKWKYPTSMIHEEDWHKKIALEAGFEVITCPARHFSGRTFKRNSSLWSSFVLITPSMKIYLGGDSGYDDHFKTIGEQYGPFDVAILECGQYNEYWKYIHMMPEEVIQAAIDLGAKKLIPVHWGKFSLSLHSWNEPIARVLAAAEKSNVIVQAPLIGQLVDLQKEFKNEPWWLQP